MLVKICGLISSWWPQGNSVLFLNRLREEGILKGAYVREEGDLWILHEKEGVSVFGEERYE